MVRSVLLTAYADAIAQVRKLCPRIEFRLNTERFAPSYLTAPQQNWRKVISVTSRLCAVLTLVILLTCTQSVLANGNAAERSGVSGELLAPHHGSVGSIEYTLTRCSYASSVSGYIAPAGCYFVVVEMCLRNLHNEPFAPEEKISIQLEDAPMSSASIEVHAELTRVLNQHTDFWDSVLEPGKVAQGYAVFCVPHATKHIWFHLKSKVGASPEKVYSGAARGLLGDLPGKEQPRIAQSGHYRVVIGSFWSEDNARKWAEAARRRGLSAFVEIATKPEGMFVVVVRSTVDLSEAMYLTEVARDHGYKDAFVSGRKR